MDSIIFMGWNQQKWWLNMVQCGSHGEIHGWDTLWCHQTWLQNQVKVEVSGWKKSFINEGSSKRSWMTSGSFMSFIQFYDFLWWLRRSCALCQSLWTSRLGFPTGEDEAGRSHNIDLVPCIHVQGEGEPQRTRMTLDPCWKESDVAMGNRWFNGFNHGLMMA